MNIDISCRFRFPIFRISLVFLAATSTTPPASGDELSDMANIILYYQRANGGWPKNYDRKKALTDDEKAKLIAAKNNNDSTIDNGATYKEIIWLAKAYQKHKHESFKAAACHGIRYLLDGQYKNGGWPQTFPNPTGYRRHITFNDNAMIGVLNLFQDIVDGVKLYSFVSDSIRKKCARAISKGIECILRCQIKQNGQLTVWCAQHDSHSFKPAAARSYELPSLSGSESVGIVQFLMRLEKPSPEVVASIDSAIKWFKHSKIEGKKLVKVDLVDSPKGYDTVIVKQEGAKPMWARFYDLRSNQPFFCSRDGMPKTSLAEISYERRNGYSWYGKYALKLLEKDVPVWRKKVKSPN